MSKCLYHKYLFYIFVSSKIKELFNLNEKSLKDTRTKYKILISNLDEYGCMTNDSEVLLTKIIIKTDKQLEIVKKKPVSLSIYNI